MERVTKGFPKSVLANLAAFVFLATLPVQATNLISDGNFNGAGSPTATTGDAGYWALPTANGGAGVPTGWSVATALGGISLDCVITNNTSSLVTSSSGSVCGTAENQNWGFNYSVPNAPGGGNYFAADGTPGNSVPLYQTVSALTVGQTYVLSFYSNVDQQAGFNTAVTAYWAVNFTPGTVTPTSSTVYTAPTGFGTPGAAPVNNQPWVLETTTFVASQASETIAFLASSPDGGGPPFALLSDVSLTATPEPGSLMLVLGLGLIGIPAACKNRGKKKDV